MLDSEFHDSLRQDIDAGAAELGEEIAGDLPSTAAEVRSEIPEELSKLVAGSDDLSEHTVQEALEAPISRFTDQRSE